MKRFQILPALAALLLLTGCMLPLGDDLLRAPQASKNYQTLERELTEIQRSQIYAAPTKGENRSTVQLVDLDGDGVEEAVSFFRGDANSAEFNVYIHKREADDYITTGSISGMGTAIQSVDYPVISPDGKRGIVVTWQLATENASALTMCSLSDALVPRVLLETEYSNMALADLTGNGAQELLILTFDPGGKRLARLYRYESGQLVLAGETSTSPEAVTVVGSLRTGRIGGSLPAVLAEQKTESGVGLTTDIFAYTDGALRNLALDREDATGRGTYRPVSVEATDINADGLIEIPRAVLMRGYEDAAATDALFMLDWYLYSAENSPARVKTTYQNVSEQWQFAIDDAWHDRITASKTSESGLTGVHFAQYVDAENSIPLFSIYCATGALRDYYAARGDVIHLAETDRAVYFAKLQTGAGTSAITIDAEGIAARFSLVTQSWRN